MIKSRESTTSALSQRILTLILIIPICISSASYIMAKPIKQSQSSVLIASYETTSDIPAGSNMIIHFSMEDQCFNKIENVSAVDGLSEVVRKAIVKSPCWIQRDLARQFQALGEPEPYAWLLLNASKQWTDELAFSLAASPLGDVASIEVLSANVAWLYAIDSVLDYAHIIDYDSSDGDYYSTIRYKNLENGSVQFKEYPKELYYWYVVHPELLGESAQLVYDTFWRSFLYNHNDIGYPLLKEKISTIEYMWDNKAYDQPANRLWDEWITNHPTAVEAISYWIGKTVPFEAIGDRPNQPNLIAHEHNGLCGELQRLAVAAMRMMLIPTVGVCNIGEDHVWREFYDDGWHQNDNWWMDSGGTVDIPDVYWKGWGKTMSAIYTQTGDGSIYDVTSRYIGPDDRLTVTFDVVDAYDQPYDGARITVFVKGIKDISWYKNTIWNSIESLWNRLPDFLKNTILQKVYQQIQQRFDKIPNVIDGVTISIWNYTDINGRCCFQLGNQDEYVFLIQGSTSRFSWPFAKWNTVRILNIPEDTGFQIKFPDISRRPPQSKQGSEQEGMYQINMTYRSSFYQVQENIRNSDMGTYLFEGSPSVFLLDSNNFERYKMGQHFQFLSYNFREIMTLHAPISEDVYIVCQNPTHQSTARITLSIDMIKESPEDAIVFVSPSDTLFEHSCFNVGDIITIRGVSTMIGKLIIDEHHIDLTAGSWSYQWNSSGQEQGEHIIQGICGNISDTMILSLFDINPPAIHIMEPENSSVVKKGDAICGSCSDASGIRMVEISVDDMVYIPLSNNTYWSYLLSDFFPGIHRLRIKATDDVGLTTTTSIDIVINGSNPEWFPFISTVSHTPSVIDNKTNVIILTNINNTELFPIRTAMVFVTSPSLQKIVPMFPYASDPILSRHPEDPLSNMTNSPCYGCELGVFSSGETVSYHLIVIDVAGHSVYSDVYTFSVQ